MTILEMETVARLVNGLDREEATRYFRVAIDSIPRERGASPLALMAAGALLIKAGEHLVLEQLIEETELTPEEARAGLLELVTHLYHSIR